MPKKAIMGAKMQTLLPKVAAKAAVPAAAPAEAPAAGEQPEVYCLFCGGCSNCPPFEEVKASLKIWKVEEGLYSLLKKFPRWGKFGDNLSPEARRKLAIRLSCWLLHRGLDISSKEEELDWTPVLTAPLPFKMNADCGEKGFSELPKELAIRFCKKAYALLLTAVEPAEIRPEIYNEDWVIILQNPAE